MADGRVEFEVRANTDKLKSDMDKAESIVKGSAKKASEAVKTESKETEKTASESASNTTDRIKKEHKEQTTSEQESTEKRKSYWTKFKEHVKQNVAETQKNVKSKFDSITDVVAHPGKTVKKMATNIKNSVNETVDKAKAKVEAGAEKISDFITHPVKTIKEASSEMLKKTSETADKATEHFSKVPSAIGGVAKGVGTGFAVIGGAAVAAGGYAVNLANDMDTAMNSFAASTGIAETEMSKYQEVLENIYKNNYGEDFQDIADVMALIKQQMGEISDTEMQSLTEAAFAFQDLSGYSPEESIRAANSLMTQFGLTSKEAYNLMVQGQQQGLDFSGELLDSINEYAPQFKKMGFSAEDMFNIFKTGSENGAFNLDKIGDAVKENAIRVIDLSDSTNEAFSLLGLDAEQMAAEFGAGGETAEKAFQKVMVGLSALEDPVERNKIGTALWGSMWEDLGETVIMGTGNITDSFDKTADSMAQIQDIQYNDLGSMLEGLKRSVEMLALPLGEMLIPAFEDLIGVITPLIEDGTLEEIISSFGAFLEPLTEIAANVLPQIVDLFSQLVSEEIMPFLTVTLLPKLMEVMEALAPILEMLLSDFLPILLDMVTQLLVPISNLATDLIPILQVVLEALEEPLQILSSELFPLLNEMIASLSPLIEAMTPVIKELAGMLADNLCDAINTAIPIITAIKDVLKGVIDFLINVFKGDWEGAWDSIVGVFKTIINAVPSVIESVVNSAINGINNLINGINSLTDVVGIPAIPNIPSFSLPRFHTGGIIDFKGQYEAPILAKDGEMVLTDVQQKRLFDIANGFFAPQGNNNNSTNMRTTNVNIEHKNYFTVRDDSDIMRISEQLSEQETKDILSVGGD